MKSLVLEVRGLNLAYLGCYGNDWVATPNIDRFAAEGVVFDRHIIAHPDTATAIGPDWVEATLERWKTETSVHVAGPSLAPPWNLPEDMLTVYCEDEVDEPWPDPPEGELTDDEGVCRVQDTYAAAVTWFDAQFGRLLAELDRVDDTLVALTASVGYPLGEHGRIGWDRPWLHEELVHAPLVVRWPGKKYAGLRVAALTQPADLMAVLDGTSKGLFDLVEGTIGELRPHAISSWKRGTHSERALRTLEWALIVPGESDPPRPRKLFAKPTDRWEVNDLAAQELDVVDDLVKRLDS